MYKKLQIDDWPDFASVNPIDSFRSRLADYAEDLADAAEDIADDTVNSAKDFTNYFTEGAFAEDLGDIGSGFVSGATLNTGVLGTGGSPDSYASAEGIGNIFGQMFTTTALTLLATPLAAMGLRGLAGTSLVASRAPGVSSFLYNAGGAAQHLLRGGGKFFAGATRQQFGNLQTAAGFASVAAPVNLTLAAADQYAGNTEDEELAMTALKYTALDALGLSLFSRLGRNVYVQNSGDIYASKKLMDMALDTGGNIQFGTGTRDIPTNLPTFQKVGGATGKSATGQVIPSQQFTEAEGILAADQKVAADRYAETGNSYWTDSASERLVKALIEGDDISEVTLDAMYTSIKSSLKEDSTAQAILKEIEAVADGRKAEEIKLETAINNVFQTKYLNSNAHTKAGSFIKEMVDEQLIKKHGTLYSEDEYKTILMALDKTVNSIATNGPKLFADSQRILKLGLNPQEFSAFAAMFKPIKKAAGTYDYGNIIKETLGKNIEANDFIPSVDTSLFKLQNTLEILTHKINKGLDNIAVGLDPHASYPEFHKRVNLIEADLEKILEGIRTSKKIKDYDVAGFKLYDKLTKHYQGKGQYDVANLQEMKKARAYLKTLQFGVDSLAERNIAESMLETKAKMLQEASGVMDKLEQYSARYYGKWSKTAAKLANTEKLLTEGQLKSADYLINEFKNVNINNKAEKTKFIMDAYRRIRADIIGRMHDSSFMTVLEQMPPDGKRILAEATGSTNIRGLNPDSLAMAMLGNPHLSDMILRVWGPGSKQMRMTMNLWRGLNHTGPGKNFGSIAFYKEFVQDSPMDTLARMHLAEMTYSDEALKVAKIQIRKDTDVMPFEASFVSTADITSLHANTTLGKTVEPNTTKDIVGMALLASHSGVNTRERLFGVLNSLAQNKANRFNPNDGGFSRVLHSLWSSVANWHDNMQAAQQTYHESIRKTIRPKWQKLQDTLTAMPETDQIKFKELTWKLDDMARKVRTKKIAHVLKDVEGSDSKFYNITDPAGAKRRVDLKKGDDNTWSVYLDDALLEDRLSGLKEAKQVAKEEINMIINEQELTKATNEILDSFDKPVSKLWKDFQELEVSVGQAYNEFARQTNALAKLGTWGKVNSKQQLKMINLQANHASRIYNGSFIVKYSAGNKYQLAIVEGKDLDYTLRKISDTLRDTDELTVMPRFLGSGADQVLGAADDDLLNGLDSRLLAAYTSKAAALKQYLAQTNASINREAQQVMFHGALPWGDKVVTDPMAPITAGYLRNLEVAKAQHFARQLHFGNQLKHQFHELGKTLNPAGHHQFDDVGRMITSISNDVLGRRRPFDAKVEDWVSGFMKQAMDNHPIVRTLLKATGVQAGDPIFKIVNHFLTSVTRFSLLGLNPKTAFVNSTTAVTNVANLVGMKNAIKSFKRLGIYKKRGETDAFGKPIREFADAELLRKVGVTMDYTHLSTIDIAHRTHPAFMNMDKSVARQLEDLALGMFRTSEEWTHAMAAIGTKLRTEDSLAKFAKKGITRNFNVNDLKAIKKAKLDKWDVDFLRFAKRRDLPIDSERLMVDWIRDQRTRLTGNFDAVALPDAFRSETFKAPMQFKAWFAHQWGYWFGIGDSGMALLRRDPTAMAKSLVAVSAFGGLLGLPGIEIAEMIGNAVFHESPEAWIHSKVPDAVAMGLPAFAGIDISDSLQFAELTPWKLAEDNKTTLALGPSARVVFDAASLAARNAPLLGGFLTTGDPVYMKEFLRRTQSAQPVPARTLINLTRMMSEGEIPSQFSPTVPQAKRNFTEDPLRTSLTAIGFRDAEYSKWARSVRALRQMKKKSQWARGRAYPLAMRMESNGDIVSAQEVLKSYEITPAQYKSWKTRVSKLKGDLLQDQIPVAKRGKWKDFVEELNEEDI